jgi:predicted PurR-regulated permease PerM
VWLAHIPTDWTQQLRAGGLTAMSGRTSGRTSVTLINSKAGSGPNAIARAGAGSGDAGTERFPSPSTRSEEGNVALAALVPELGLMTRLVIASVIVTALYFGRDILIPLALAFLRGFVLDPLVIQLKHWGVPRTPAVILVVLLTLALLGLAGLFLGSQVSALSAQLPIYQGNIKNKLRALREVGGKPGTFDAALKTLDTIKAEIESASAPNSGRRDAMVNANPPPPQRVHLEEKAPSPFQQASGWLEAGGRPLANAGIVLVFVVLILLDRFDLRDRLLRLWGGTLHQSTDAMDEAGARISKYLTMQLVVNLSYGVPMALGLWFIGVPGALL